MVSRSAFAFVSDTPGFQSSENAKTGMIAAVENTFFFAQLRERNPDLRKARKFYLLRQNANDFTRDAIDNNLLPEHFSANFRSACAKPFRR